MITTMEGPEDPQTFRDDALAATAVTVKTGAGVVLAIDIWNASNATAYVQILDATNAASGDDASIVATVAVKTLEHQHVEFTRPLRCRADTNPGIRVAACTSRLGNGAPSSALSVEVHYK